MMTLKQRLDYLITRALLWLLMRIVDLPVHDSWSAPRTPAERDLLRLRLEQLEKMQPQPQVRPDAN